MHLSFFFCLFRFFALRRLSGMLVLTHLSVVATTLLFTSTARYLFLFCLFAFVFIIHHTTFLSFGLWFFSLRYLLLLQYVGGNILLFVIVFFVLFYLVDLNASISSLGVKAPGFWIWKRASKLQASTFLSFPPFP
jgi:hypothetical protein